jgi:hypothetical protein
MVGALELDQARGHPFVSCFSSANAAAIGHNKELARGFGHKHPLEDRDLVMVVIDEAGSEIHREHVYPEFTIPNLQSPSARLDDRRLLWPHD